MASRPRVGMDARYAFRKERRGIGEYVFQLLRAYAQEPTDLDFILYVDNLASEGPVLPPDRFTVRRLPASNPLLFEESVLPRAAFRDGVGLLHLTANYGGTFYRGSIVYTVQDLIEFVRSDVAPWGQDWRHRAGRFWRTAALRRSAPRADAVICPSEATRRDVERILHVPSDRIAVIPYAVEGLRPHPRPRTLREDLRRRGYPVPEVYVLAFGALDPRKNARVAVEAFEAVAEAVPGSELWIVGVEDVRAYCQTPLRPWLTVQPFLPRRDAVDLLRAASAFVYPSLYEGFGFPALEALAAGVPLLASGVSSLPEVVGDAGVLFDARDATALARALVKVLSDRTWAQKLSERGLDRAAHFSWAKTASQHIDVYQKVLGMAGGAGKDGK